MASLISCPHCGLRPREEFSIRGAALTRPAVEASGEEWFAYVYLRDNPRGDHDEHWRHASGCGRWLVVARNTLTHEILGVRDAGATRHDLLSACPDGGRIDRSAPLAFQFDGKRFVGQAGDTLASALLASGVSLMGRSFKYHRPRGVVTAGAAEPNALVTIGEGGRREANARATMVELYDGLVANSQNRWPSLQFDVGAVEWPARRPFSAAGFYYKTFMWPARLWERLYEPAIRRAAGLGRAASEPDPDAYEKVWAHCDLLIVGGGPAGIAAALTAARAGAETLVVDENSEFGGGLLTESASIGGASAAEALGRMLAELRTFPNCRLLARTTAAAWYDDMMFAAVERVQKHVADPVAHEPVERLWRIVAKRALLCTGAQERPIVFGGNDRPGVMLAEAGLAYARRFGVAVGRRVGVFTNTDSGARAARALDRRMASRSWP